MTFWGCSEKPTEIEIVHIPIPYELNNLSITSSTISTISVNWVVPDSIDETMKPVSYEVRYSDTLISESNWDMARIWQSELRPTSSDSIFHVTLSNLGSNRTYYIGIRFKTNNNELSPISNIIATETQPILQISERYDLGTDFRLWNVKSADLNGDSYNDLVISMNKGTLVGLNNGHGKFESFTKYDNWEFGVIALADCDGDNDIDIIKNHSDIHGKVTIGFNNGAGAFDSTSDFGGGTYTSYVVTGDLNNDGNVDIISLSGRSDFLIIHMGRGDGTFFYMPEYVYTLGDHPITIVLHDFNNNNILDIAVANHSSNDVTILRGKGDGTFYPMTLLKSGAYSSALCTGDFDLNGTTDLVVGHGSGGTPAGSLFVYKNPGNAVFSQQDSFEAKGLFKYMETMDLNGDGYTDIIYASSNPNRIGVLLNSKGVGFNEAGYFSATNTIYGNVPSICLSDVDADGNKEVIVVYEYGTVLIYKNIANTF